MPLRWSSASWSRASKALPRRPASAGSQPIYGGIGHVAFGGRFFVYGTDMAGNLVEYAVARDGCVQSSVVERGMGD